MCISEPRLTCYMHDLSVVLATYWQAEANPIGVPSDNLNYIPPETIRETEQLGVAKKVKSSLCSRKRHTYSVFDGKKPNLFFGVVPNEGQEHNVVFFTLIGIHSHHLERTSL